MRRGDAKLRGLLTAGDPGGEVQMIWHMLLCQGVVQERGQVWLLTLNEVVSETGEHLVGESSLECPDRGSLRFARRDPLGGVVVSASRTDPSGRTLTTADNCGVYAHEESLHTNESTRRGQRSAGETYQGCALTELSYGPAGRRLYQRARAGLPAGGPARRTIADRPGRCRCGR